MGILYLIASVIFTTLFASFYKIANRRGCDLVNVNTVLYASGALTLGVVTAIFLREPLSAKAVLLGVVAGAAGYFSTATFLYVMAERHLSTAWTVISLAVILPTLGSVIVYREYPTPAQWLGIVVMCLALVAIGFGRSGDTVPDGGETPAATLSPLKGRIYFLISFLCTGFVSFTNKVAAAAMDRMQVPAYMMIYYLSAVSLALALRAWRPKNYQPRDLWVGGLMGVAGALGILTFTMTLTYLQGIIAFPVRACANLLLTAAVGFVVWRERPGFGGTLGIFLGALALVLVNMKGS